MNTTAASQAKHSGRQFSLAALVLLLTLVSIVLAIYVRYYLAGVVFAAFVIGLVLVAFGAALRHTRLLGAGAILAWVSLVLLLLAGSGIVWTGQSLVTLTFFVVDAETGQPLPNATVRLRELPFASDTPPLIVPPGERGAEMRTSERGRATITYKFVTQGKSRLLMRDTATALLLEDFYIHVAADGYQPLIVPLHEVTGHTIELHWPQQPPPIELRLQRE